ERAAEAHGHQPHPQHVDAQRGGGHLVVARGLDVLPGPRVHEGDDARQGEHEDRRRDPDVHVAALGVLQHPQRVLGEDRHVEPLGTTQDVEVLHHQQEHLGEGEGREREV
ncbi:MAG: hypothetical protein AVDCRST_MAG06-2728, partial [uncultured Nocardioides sp.]